MRAYAGHLDSTDLVIVFYEKDALILVKGKDHLAERVEIHVRAKGKKATKVE